MEYNTAALLGLRKQFQRDVMSEQAKTNSTNTRRLLVRFG